MDVCEVMYCERAQIALSSKCFMPHCYTPVLTDAFGWPHMSQALPPNFKAVFESLAGCRWKHSIRRNSLWSTIGDEQLLCANTTKTWWHKFATSRVLTLSQFSSQSKKKKKQLKNRDCAVMDGNQAKLHEFFLLFTWFSGTNHHTNKS